MAEQEEHNLRWSWFKIIFTIILMTSAGTGIYFATAPLIEGEYNLKSFANLAFAIILIFYIFGLFGVRKNYEWVFWACNFGLMIFCSIMFLKYETLFG